MTNPEMPFKPLKASDRIQSLDIMRGIVLLGILLMNINGMGLAGAYEDPTVSGGSTGWDLATWITTNMLFEGTMRALFSLLFGPTRKKRSRHRSCKHLFQTTDLVIGFRFDPWLFIVVDGRNFIQLCINGVFGIFFS